MAFKIYTLHDTIARGKLMRKNARVSIVDSNEYLLMNTSDHLILATIINIETT